MELFDDVDLLRHAAPFLLRLLTDCRERLDPLGDLPYAPPGIVSDARTGLPAPGPCPAPQFERRNAPGIPSSFGNQVVSCLRSLAMRTRRKGGRLPMSTNGAVRLCADDGDGWRSDTSC